MSKTTFLLTGACVLSLSLIGLVYFLKQPATKIVTSLTSPDDRWIADIKIEMYGTFGGSYYSVVIAPNTGVFRQLQQEKVLTVTDNVDSSQPINIAWNSPKELHISLTPNTPCERCVSLKKRRFKDITISYDATLNAQN